MTRRHRSAGIAAAVCALALVTAGCGTTDSLVGLRDAPAESASGAPLDDEGATVIAARVLSAARAEAETKGDKGHEARAKVMRGDALSYADALADRGAAGGAADTLAKDPQPTVIAQSQGREWPRAILATTFDEASSTQYLHVMASRAPEEPFLLESTVPMFGGAELPAVTTEGAGSPFLDPASDEGLVRSPANALEAYAAALARPEPKKPIASVTTEDAFGARLGDSAALQVKSLKKLASLTQAHEARTEHTVAFRLADGSAVTFGLLVRTDTITVGKKAKELVLPKRYADLVGSKKVTKKMSLKSLEPVVLVVPPEGDVRAIGATELLVSGKGS
ncbi:hypothetical protein JQN72_14515 [Phycicoccus sp. CSK15P-2]|uniref:hypothetical protein n=1 Tax=Phycicoccus sp. CSK15P-2 TaxID=2807627 RepID=UPI00194DE754|nr:hypothetical protein [Phycicoccus sp. CSK15P-2]MBM6405456.1 hypothetical protein [Phycicoccus sp. CSK15P-2]